MGYFVGAISGTSVDGLDLALVEIEADSVVVKQAITIPFPKQLRTRVFELASESHLDVVRLGHIDAELGTFIGEQIVQFIVTSGHSIDGIAAIGSHGQTIRHVPNDLFGFSYQIGAASRIAAITGISTVANFRAADLAVGGQGAPLVPVFHDRIFRSSNADRVILNVGGIANVTLLPAKPNHEILGFDTGPGNTLIDAWTRHNFNRDYDHEGELARTGSIVADLLTQLLSNPWLNETPPKSTGIEHFNLNYILNMIRTSAVNSDPIHILSTLTEFTAITISQAILRWCSESGEVIVCGGGRLNHFLMRRVATHLPNHLVQNCDELGYDGDAIEAATFAYLAYLFVNDREGNIPSVTGAQRGRILGCLHPA